MIVKLDRRCRIEKPVNSIDPVYGSNEKTWQLLAVVWCNVQDVLPSRSEAVKNGLVVGILS